MRKYILLFIFTFGFFLPVLDSYSQNCNLVPNPGFEDGNCPNSSNDFPTSWGAPGGSPDYCGWGCGIDATHSFYRTTCSKRMNGFYTVWIPYNGIDYREYIQAKLISPLIAGTTYCVSFYTRFASNSGGINQATDNIGAYFTSTAVKPPSPPGNGPIVATPQIESPKGVPITSTTAWVLVSGSFVAVGGEQYITLGNFRTNANTTLSKPRTSDDRSYYYVDDILVKDCNASCDFNAIITPPNKTICSGQCVDIAAEVTGGTSPYTVTWTPNIGSGVGPHKVCPTSTTTYNFTAVDNSSCKLAVTGSTTITVGGSCGPTVTTTGGNICSGVCTNITATGTGGTSPYTYSWNPGTGTGSSFNVCPTTTTTYTVITTDKNGGTASNKAVVTVNTAPTVNITGTLSICSGGSTVLTGTGGGTYSWSTGETTTSITVKPTVSPTTYSIIATNNGCTGSKAVSVTITPNPTPTISGNTTICVGGNTTLTANGGDSYIWSTTATTTAITVSPGNTTTYTVTASSGGCTGATTVIVTVESSFTPVITGKTTICKGTSTTLSTSGGGDYSWSTGSTTTSITVSPITPTSYSVTVTNGSCSGTATVEVTPIAIPTPTISGTTSICSGSSTILTASGGSTYLWDNGATTTSITVSPTAQTTYTVTANTGGCTGQTTVVVNVSQPVVAAITGIKTICIGGNTTLTASGGGTYIWSTTEVTTSITVSPGGTTSYTVLVTNGSCTGSASVNVTVAANLSPIITGNTTICPGTSTTLSTSGGGDYSWSDASTTSSITVSPVTTTSYSVTVTNGSCSGTATVEVTPIANPTPTISGTTSVCVGTSTTLTAFGGSTYLWNNGATTTSITVSPIIPTTYTVTANIGGCTGQTTVVVSISSAPIPLITGVKAICKGGSTTLTASGGGTYLWSTTEITTSITVSPNVTSTYTVTVTTGCTATATVEVTVQSTLVPIITGKDSICKGTSTTLSTGGGTYVWSTSETSPDITVSPSSSQSYSVTVTSGSCSGTASVQVTVIDNPVPIISGTMAICSGQSTTLTAIGGNTYLWSTSEITSSINVNPQVNTDYVVIATINGCTGFATASVGVTQSPKPVISGINNICFGQSTTLSENVTGGPYLWSTGETSSSITVNPTSNKAYTVSVTQNNCPGTATIMVNVTPKVVAVIKGDSICAGEIASLTASGGSTYVWNTTETSPTISVSPGSTTTYTAIVAIGTCADTTTYTVKVNPLPIALASGSTTISYGNSTLLTSSGGGTYNWLPPTGLSCSNCASPTASPTGTTQYCVVVQTPAGCSDSACVTVIVDLTCGFEGELFVPNGFSPNGDGQNDVLYVRGAGITGIFWVIYDRWGEKVFETTNPKQGWDGTYKGKQLDPGVFVYYLEVTCITGDQTKQKGNVAIIK